MKLKNLKNYIFKDIFEEINIHAIYNLSNFLKMIVYCDYYFSPILYCSINIFYIL